MAEVETVIKLEALQTDMETHMTIFSVHKSDFESDVDNKALDYAHACCKLQCLGHGKSPSRKLHVLEELNKLASQ